MRDDGGLSNGEASQWQQGLSRGRAPDWTDGKPRSGPSALNPLPQAGLPQQETVSWAAEKSDYLLLPVRPPTERERESVYVCLSKVQVV